jgi:hypothetical protein
VHGIAAVTGFADCAYLVNPGHIYTTNICANQNGGTDVNASIAGNIHLVYAP